MKNRLRWGLPVVTCCMILGCGSTTTEPRSPEQGQDAAPANSEEQGPDAEMQAADDADSTVDESQEGAFRDPATAGPEMEIPLIPKSGSSIVGEARFTETPKGVNVVVEIRDAEPGLHGVHIHENPDCSAPDAASAGPHFNPTDHPHGLPKQDQRHLGDLGNIEVGEDRTGRLEIFVRLLDLGEKDSLSFRKRALIVHAKPDTGAQPSGNSGARIACAEITQEAAQIARSTASTNPRQ